MPTQEEYDLVCRKCSEYDADHPEIVVSFDCGAVKQLNGTIVKMWWVSIGKEPWPYDPIVTRKESMSRSPQEALDKAVKIASLRGLEL